MLKQKWIGFALIVLGVVIASEMLFTLGTLGYRVDIMTNIVGYRANLSNTSSFTVPEYSVATLNYEFLIEYDYKYSEDSIAVITTSTLDGVQIEHTTKDDPTLISFSMPFTLPSGLHTFHFGSYSIILGRGVSRFNGTLNVWLEYDSTSNPPPSGNDPVTNAPLSVYNLALGGVVAVVGVYFVTVKKNVKT